MEIMVEAPGLAGAESASILVASSDLEKALLSLLCFC
jgi:hypothetical protein